ncbi:hypothetical protein H6G96_27545 [Nostoc sp. FACHB-892]|uniref:hypothetical protein n=1 Tax=Nostoc sp. FACHB-892 TaxID=2692843 RepID=UPI0016862FBE|nr:hypothetical protein [Nostoc sp. FACHB-892]MBD2729973.1 hypothetical protein [Nostoc sp. FACHB-892]
MVNLDYLKQQAREMAAEAARAHKEAEAAQKAIDDAKAFASKSSLNALNVIQDAIRIWIKQGTLTRRQSEVYLNRYRELWGLEKAQNEYLRLAANLLNHPHYGVETTTSRFGNGGLIWKGQNYKNTQALYEAIQEVLGSDPFDSVEWVNEILELVFDDSTKLAADTFLPDRFTSIANLIRRIVQEAKTPINIPDISQFTADDAAFLSAFLGRF